MAHIPTYESSLSPSLAPSCRPSGAARIVAHWSRECDTPVLRTNVCMYEVGHDNIGMCSYGRSLSRHRGMHCMGSINLSIRSTFASIHVFLYGVHEVCTPHIQRRGLPREPWYPPSTAQATKTGSLSLGGEPSHGHFLVTVRVGSPQPVKSHPCTDFCRRAKDRGINLVSGRCGGEDLRRRRMVLPRKACFTLRISWRIPNSSIAYPGPRSVPFGFGDFPCPAGSSCSTCIHQGASTTSSAPMLPRPSHDYR